MLAVIEMLTAERNRLRLAARPTQQSTCKNKHEPGHILLPGQSFMPPPAPELHEHGPKCQHYSEHRR